MAQRYRPVEDVPRYRPVDAIPDKEYVKQVYPVVAVAEVAEVVAIAVSQNLTRRETAVRVNKVLLARKGEIKSRMVYEVSRISQTPYSKWKNYKIAGRTSAQVIENSFNYQKRVITNKASYFKQRQDRALKHLAEGNRGYLAKYGVTDKTSNTEAIIRINKQLKKELIADLEASNLSHQKRLLKTQNTLIRSEERKEWRKENGGLLLIIPQDGYCDICANYVFQTYPNEISSLPPYHPNCQCVPQKVEKSEEKKVTQSRITEGKKKAKPFSR